MKQPRNSLPARKLREAETLDEICRLLKIPLDFGAVIVCDGSATKWSEATGWAWTLIRQKPAYFRLDGNGSASCGSNIFAELMGFLHPLTWLAQQKIRGVLSVYVISDCELMSKWGKSGAPRSAYEELFFLIGAYARRGLKIDYRWLPRDTIDLNKFCHEMANVARKWQVGEPHKPTTAPVQRRKILRKLGADTIYDLSPSE